MARRFVPVSVVVVTFLALAAAPAGAEARAIAPYLVAEPGGALQLSWRSGLMGDEGVVELFAGERALTAVTAERVGDLFRARLPFACDDEGRLTYRLVGMDEPVEVRRPPCAGEGAVRFSFLTDTQQDAALSGRFAARLAERDVDFVLHGGDVVQVGGNDREWIAILNEMSRFARSVPLVPAAGNHEYIFDGEGELLAKYLGLKDEGSWYRFSSGPVDVFVLNSCYAFDRERRNAQVLWLRAELARSEKERPGAWRLVLFHHPPFSLGIAHAPWFWKREYEVMRRYYVPAFEDHGVDLVLSGHTHLYERSLKDGVHYVTGGSAGGIMGWFGGKNPHSQLARKARTVSHLEASRERLTLTSETLTGEIVDELVLERPSKEPALHAEKAPKASTAIPEAPSAR